MANQTFSLLQEQRQVQILAPQLRQSLEMLQLPVLELRTLVQKELQQNPTLEEKASDNLKIEVEQDVATVDDTREMDFKEEFEILSRMDDEWHEYFMQAQEYQAPDPHYHQKQDFLINKAGESLQEHLRRQLAVADLDGHSQLLGQLLIGTINDDGYLTQDLTNLAESTGDDPARLQDVLHLIQDFDPIGVGARDLKECLLLQIERLGYTETLAARIIEHHLELLASRDYQAMARKLNQSVLEVQQAARLIATLDPRPGQAYSSDITQYVTPDISVEKHDGRYVVIVNNDQLPRLRISRHYRQLMQESGTKPEVKEYIRERIRSGAFLIKSIAQRQQTVYRVASEIVRVQTDFLDYGIAHLKPLVMADIAKEVKLHETTVSRSVANKYMQTPQGLFEMKYFFTPGLKTKEGEVISNKTVQDMIQALVAREDTSRPYTDQDIQKQLKAQGVQVARRTVAKYRVALKIPPSHLRKI